MLRGFRKWPKILPKHGLDPGFRGVKVGGASEASGSRSLRENRRLGPCFGFGVGPILSGNRAFHLSDGASKSVKRSRV
jgi:hypothetical protein